MCYNIFGYRKLCYKNNYMLCIYKSEYFSTKNYDLDIQSNQFSIQVQPSEAFYSTLQYNYTNKNNDTGIETATINEIKLIVNQVFSSKINIQADLSFAQTQFNGEKNNSIAYEMLNGLQSGQNLIWTATYNHKLTKTLQLNIGYNGRSSEQNKAIHNGSIQLTANF